MEPLRFIGVGDLLEDIGRGLGTASAALVRTSGTPIGTLAIKTADVTVSFEMTSAAIARGVNASIDPNAFLLGAKTLTFGTSTFQETQTNRCAIALHIVSVAAPYPPAATDTAATPVTPNATDAAHTTAALPAGEKDRLTGLLTGLRAAAARASMSDRQRAAIGEELTAIDALLRKNELEEARGALASFATSHLKNLDFGE